LTGGLGAHGQWMGNQLGRKVGNRQRERSERAKAELAGRARRAGTALAPVTTGVPIRLANDTNPAGDRDPDPPRTLGGPRIHPLGIEPSDLEPESAPSGNCRL
jgi:hypothetical protein